MTAASEVLGWVTFLAIAATLAALILRATNAHPVTRPSTVTGWRQCPQRGCTAQAHVTVATSEGLRYVCHGCAAGYGAADTLDDLFPGTSGMAGSLSRRPFTFASEDPDLPDPASLGVFR